MLAISWVFDELPSCDERTYIDLLVEACDLEAIRIRGDHAWPLRDLECLALNPNTPVENLYRELKDLAYQASSQAEATVLLNCAFGDSSLHRSGILVDDLLREGRFGEALRGFGGFCANPALPTS